MPSSTVCWGIELGAGSVKALKLERDGDNLKVLDFAVIPHKRVLSTPDLDQSDATRVALGTLVSQYDLTGERIAVSVPGHSAFARFAKLPPVEPKKIPDIVKFEAVQQIPFPIDDVEWDYQTFANPDSPDVEVGIFAITRDRIMERLATWADVGITPDYVTLSPIAAFNAIAFDLAFTDKTPGTVILDVGTTSTDLIVAEAGRVWVRTFPIGGHQFTEALVEAFKLTYTKAEKLKREAETSKHARHVFQAMRPVFSDLAQDVQRSIGYYQSLHRDANLTRLIGLGSTFNLPGLKKYLSQQLQMEVVQLTQFNRLSVEGPKSGEFQAATGNLATCYGLALQGVGLNAINANLMPKAVVRDAMWRRKTKWFAVAAGLSLVAGAVSFGRYFMDETAAAAKPLPTVVAKAKDDLRKLKAQWATVESSYKADFQAANASLLLDGRDVVPFLVDDLGQIMARSDSVAKAGAKPDAKSPEAARGLIFNKFQTQYQASGFAGEEDNFVAPPPRREAAPREPDFPESGGKRGMAPPPKKRAAPPPPPPPTGTSNDGPWPPGEGPPRMSVTLTVSTTSTDQQVLVRDTVMKWLMENASREGVPYTIAKNTLNMKRIAQVEVQKAEPDPAPNLALNLGGGGNAGPLGKRKRKFDPVTREEDFSDILITAGGRNDPSMLPTNPADKNAVQAQNVLDQLAPVPKPPPVDEAGTKLTTFEVHWDAVIKPRTPKENPA